MKIVSDFSDYYDVHATDEGPTLYRSASDVLPRRDIFVLLNALKFKVPIHGKVSILYDALLTSFETTDEKFRADKTNDVYKVVVYDGSKHDQSSLRLMPVLEALEKCPNSYASQYIPTGDTKTTSYEWYKVGNHQFWIEQSSDDEFRSGVGAVTQRIVGGANSFRNWNIPDLSKIFKTPLIRVAFIGYQLTNGRRGITAIDIDTTPKLAGTAIEAELDSEECYNAINQALSSGPK